MRSAESTQPPSHVLHSSLSCVRRGFLCTEQVLLAPQQRQRLLILLGAATRAKMDQQPVLALTQDPSEQECLKPFQPSSVDFAAF